MKESCSEFLCLCLQMLDPLSMSSPENSASGSCPSLDSPLDRSAAQCVIQSPEHQLLEINTKSFYRNCLRKVLQHFRQNEKCSLLFLTLFSCLF